MTGCFDFRLRASPSVDLDRIHSSHDTSRFQMSFSKLFRSRSDGSVKTTRFQSEGPSSRTARSRALRSPSPVASAGSRRRYVRVVRSDERGEARQASEESAHVIIRSRSYSSADQMRLKKSTSADAGVAIGARGAQLQRVTSPYTPSGHTILKKYNQSLDDAGTGTGNGCASGAAGATEVSPPNSKHTSFREEVEILEYDTKGRALLVKGVTHTTTKLNYEDEDDSLNIEGDSFDDDDDLASTDFTLTDIKDATTTSASATAPSPASSINRLSLESEAAEEAPMQNLDLENGRFCVDDKTSSSVSTLSGKGESLDTPSIAPIISDQHTREVFPRRFGGTPNVAESCFVAAGHQLPVSESCPENGDGLSKTLISCPGSSLGSLSTPDSCPESRNDFRLTFESMHETDQYLSDHVHPCPAHPLSTISNSPSTTHSGCTHIQSSIDNENSFVCQYKTDHIVDAQALVTSDDSSNLQLLPQSNREKTIDRQVFSSSSSTIRSPPGTAAS